MHRDDPSRIQERYPDILREGDDEAVVRVVRDLDLAYQLGTFPLDSTAPRRADLWHRRFQPPVRRRVWRWRLTLAGALVLAVFAVIGVTVAASNILNLGKPTNTTSTVNAFPLSGFHRVKDNLRAGGKPEMLFLAAGGTFSPDSILVERWPMVKALTQFGRLSGVKSVDSACTPVANWPFPVCSIPSFDFSHANYTSPYLEFSSKDLIRWAGKKVSVYQKMSPAERRIFEKYAAFRGPLTCYKSGPAARPVPYQCHGYLHLIENSLANQTPHHLPLLMIGDYLQLDSQDMVSGDFKQQIPIPTPPSAPHPAPDSYDKVFSFDTVHDALLQGKDPIPDSHLVEDVNAEANIITALICHADGAQPSKVCGRAAIKQILRHVR